MGTSGIGSSLGCPRATMATITRTPHGLPYSDADESSGHSLPEAAALFQTADEKSRSLPPQTG